MEVSPVKTSLIKESDNLFEVLKVSTTKNKQEICERDILVITSKVVALTEGRKVFQEESLEKIVEKEADRVLSKGDYALTLKNGAFMPNAGIDHSNLERGYLITLPKDPQRSADLMRKKIKDYFKLKDVGVVICDSHCQPLRKGVTGLALAFSGFEGIEDLRGKKDLFGKKFSVTQRNLADQIASAALIVMGEGQDGVPFALIKKCSVKFTDRQIKSDELLIKLEDCLFKTLYGKI